MSQCTPSTTIIKKEITKEKKKKVSKKMEIMKNNQVEM
jgi:hypothetical protein